RAADVGVEDRRAVRGALGRGLAIELVVENGADRAVAAGADLKGAQAGRLHPLAAEGLGEPYDAQAGAEALFGMAALFQDQFAQRAGGAAYGRGLAADALDRPIGEVPVARRHVLRGSRVAVVAGVADMGGDALALAEYLHRARREADFEFVFGEPVGDAVIVVLDLDMIIEPGAPHPPLGIDVRLRGQGLEHRPVQFFEELLAGDAEPAQRAASVDIGKHLLNSLVQLRKAVEGAMAQAAQEIALDNKNA